MGSLAYGIDDDAQPEELTVGQQMHNPEYGIRMKHLNDKRRDTGTITPCQKDPKTWDSIDLEYSWKSGRLYVRRVDLERELERISKAVEGCRACPLLADCEPLREVATSNEGTTHRTLKVDAEGVIGGSLIDSTKSAWYINQYLATGAWHKDLRLQDGDSGTG
jgi:hypothetical protein